MLWFMEDRISFLLHPWILLYNSVFEEVVTQHNASTRQDITSVTLAIDDQKVKAPKIDLIIPVI